MGYLVLIVFLLLWGVLFWLCALVLRDVVKFLRALPGAIRDGSRYREFERRIGADREKISRMTAGEAESLLEPFLGMAARLTARQGPVGPSVQTILRELDTHLARFLARHRSIFLPLSDDESGGVTLSAELPAEAASLTDSRIPEGLTPIGISDHGELILGVRAGAPQVYRIREGTVVGDYPSVFHFILLSRIGD